jgi:hypothetical protein
MKSKILFFVAFSMVCLLGSLSAETTGYLYYAGGGLPDAGDANATYDGTLTGDNAVFSVLVADVYVESGIVNNWRYATGTSNKLSGHDDSSGYSWMFNENTTHVYNGFLYVGPADWNGDSARATADVVAWAEINEGNGSLGAWSYSSPIVSDGDDQAICATGIVETGGNVYYYVLGGVWTGLDRVAYAPINPDGSLGSWSTTTALPSGDWFNRATVVDGTIIHATGNLNSGNDRHIHYAAPASGGSISSWSDGGLYDSASGNMWDYAMTNAEAGGKKFAVIIAGRDGTGTTGNVDRVNVAEVTGGTPGSWSTNTNPYLGGEVRHLTAVGISDLIISLGGTAGGNSSTADSEVYLGRINSSGEITWSLSSTSMSQPRGMGGVAFHPYAFPPVLGAQHWHFYE